MDEIKDFFNMEKTFERRPLPAGLGSNNWALVSKDKSVFSTTCNMNFGTEYVKDVAAKEKFKLDEVVMPSSNALQSATETQSETASNLDDLDSLLSVCSTEKNFYGIAKLRGRMRIMIYDRYSFSYDDANRNMPIQKYRKEILDAIHNNPVVVLQGNTGCGKTTQVPQFILDDAYQRQEYCKIVCTQPRRIAAISVAKRVSQERKWPEGAVVGYQVGLLRNVQEDTCITYCTNGVLLQKLVHDKSLNSFTHIILDEIHERTDDLDFLFVVIRKLLITNSKHVKIILMSATIDTKIFSNYFKISHKAAPIIKVDNIPLYNVKEFYLDDLSRITMNVPIDLSTSVISKEMYIVAVKLLVVIDNIEKAEEFKQLKHHVKDNVASASVLVFLPGLFEIDEMCRKIEHLSAVDGIKTQFSLLRMHSLISAEEQFKIFKPAPPGFRKIILSTNMAESSITVPDVKYVIDFCLTKVQMINSGMNFTSLQTIWASRTNCQQRAGRAGRVMNGRVYRLVTKLFYNEHLTEYSTPEMLRSPLDSLVLRAKILDMGTPVEILGLAMSPPNLSDIHNTIKILKEMGALYRFKDNRYVLDDGLITYMGRIMADMPIDIQLTRLIIFGCMFSVPNEAIIIAAGLSVRSIFKYTIDPNECLKVYIQKLLWADGSGSDLFAILKAYRVWVSMREHNNMRSEENEISWAYRYSINLRSIKEMHLLVLELEDRLKNYNLNISELTSMQQQRVHWLDREKTIVLKIVIAAAFYPNYFTRLKNNNAHYERSIYQELDGNDPTRTVFFSGFPTQHIRELYIPGIKNLFRNARINPKDIEIKFQPGSEKVYVQFKDETANDLDNFNENVCNNRLLVPGRVQSNVYKALRMRVAKTLSIIDVINYKSEIKFAEKHNLGKMVNGVWRLNQPNIKNINDIVLPSLCVKKMKGKISHIENCGKFYFLPLSKFETMQCITRLLDMAYDGGLLQTFQNYQDIELGMILAAPFEKKYQRARVIRKFKREPNIATFQVFFIDIGNTDCFDFTKLREIRNFDLASKIIDTPPQIFQCRLAMVQPAAIISPNGKWTNEATTLMEYKLKDVHLVEIEVYSLVDCVANIIIYFENQETLNELLVQKSMARRTEENYLSKMDHNMRVAKQSFAASNNSSPIVELREKQDYLLTTQSLRTNYLMAPLNQMNDNIMKYFPPKISCKYSVYLRGPFSPMETNLLPANKNSFWKSVLTERDSVNSIVLNTDPQDTHERIMVAAKITESSSGNSLLARGSTLMPNIPGFGPLVSMIFCPIMQLKCNEQHTKYIGLLTGLGHSTTTFKPLFAEHDLFFQLDVEFDNNDFELINQLRYCMDALLLSDPYTGRHLVMPQQCADLKAKIKELIIKLFSKRKVHFDCTPVDDGNMSWEKYKSGEILEGKTFLEENFTIFPMHSIPYLKNLNNTNKKNNSINKKK